MKKLHVREIASLPADQVFYVPEEHIVVFDDKEEIQSCRNETIYTHMFLELFREYPNVQILKKHHVATVLKGGSLDSGTHLKLCTNIFKSIVLEEGLHLPEQKEPLLKRIYEVISSAMSRLSLITEENVTSIDILDFIQIAKHPTIEGYRQEAFRDPKNKVKYAYEKTIEAIKTLPEFYHNGLAKAVRSRMVKDNQVVQCVAFRGFPTEVDGSIYRLPNWGSYTLGNTSLYNFVSDSRTAAKSHYYSDGALQNSEYTARKLQLYTSRVERVVYKDCMSDEHMPWRVRGPEYDETGTMTYQGDLVNMIGKYYKEDDSDEYKVIDGTENHLSGKYIRLRTATHCKTPNPHEVCHICAGALTENISRFDNLGHLCASTATRPVTQSILSIKHVNMSSTMVKIRLKDHERAFMNTGPEGSQFFFNTDLKKMQPKLTVVRDEAFGLVDLKNISDLDKLSLARVSRLQEVQISLQVKNRGVTANLDVTQKTKPSLMSAEFLKYVKKKGWTVDERSNFVFDLSDWDFNQPVFVMPNKEESYVDLSNAVEAMVSGSQQKIEDRLRSDSADRLLQDLFEAVNAKLKVNILALEVIVYGLMVESATSYAPGRNSPEAVLGLRDKVINYGSLGAALAYQGLNEIVTDPINYFQGRRTDNPMDVFLAPEEVMKQP